jgi:hypothetical protein
LHALAPGFEDFHMPIDLASETIIPLGEVPSRLPPGRSGKPLSFSAVWRWALRGIKTPQGIIKLETVKLGGRLLTSEQALQRFAERQSAWLGDTAALPLPRTPGKRRRDSERAAQQLEEVGI